MQYIDLYNKIQVSMQRLIDPEKRPNFDANVVHSHSLRIADFLFEREVEPIKLVYSGYTGNGINLTIHAEDGSVFKNHLSACLGKNSFVAYIRQVK